VSAYHAAAAICLKLSCNGIKGPGDDVILLPPKLLKLVDLAL
jgi:hypothetical protein